MADGITTEDLFFANMISKAEILAVLSFLDELGRQVGLQDPDGLSVVDRFYRQRKVELESLFRSLEDRNPALAARLHGRYQEAAAKLAADNS